MHSRYCVTCCGNLKTSILQTHCLSDPWDPHRYQILILFQPVLLPHPLPTHPLLSRHLWCENTAWITPHSTSSVSAVGLRIWKQRRHGSQCGLIFNSTNLYLGKRSLLEASIASSSKWASSTLLYMLPKVFSRIKWNRLAGTCPYRRIPNSWAQGLIGLPRSHRSHWKKKKSVLSCTHVAIPRTP